MSLLLKALSMSLKQDRRLKVKLDGCDILIEAKRSSARFLGLYPLGSPVLLMRSRAPGESIERLTIEYANADPESLD
jgi:hypothetical protein